MAIVIRVAYNNANWRNPCKAPGKDPLCWYCFEDILDIISPKRTDEICSGHCWEQHLCTEYKWGCTPKGRMFSTRAQPGTKVFFAYKQPDGKYTIWGKTTVHGIDDKPVEKGRDDELGFAFIRFNPFEPLPTDKWVKNLSDVELVRAKWLQGRYRYIDSEKEAYIESLIGGEVPLEKYHEGPIQTSNDTININIEISPNIYKRLKAIATEEGRQTDEIVREAIAEWVRGRIS